MIGVVGAVDAGNTRTKWAVFRDGSLFRDGVWPDSPTPPLCGLEEAGRWKLAGPNPEALLAAKVALEANGKTCVVVSDPASIGLEIDLKHPEKVGTDRIAAAWAAWLRSGRAHACVVVDSGTTVTVDYVDQAGVFRGGAILPGVDLMAQSLASGTRLLPRVFPADIPVQPQWPGRCTREAIAAGIMAAQAGAVSQLIARARERTPDARVFLTGGGSGFLAGALDMSHEIVGHLVLEGIAMAGDRTP